MSTRALYTFGPDNNGDTLNVYKHHDGYPEGAAQWIEAAKSNAWELPRFEADEFAASFVAANKTDKGGVRLMPSGSPKAVILANCSDVDYRYQITCKENELHVDAYAVNSWGRYAEKKIYSGPLDGLNEIAGA